MSEHIYWAQAEVPEMGKLQVEVFEEEGDYGLSVVLGQMMTQAGFTTCPKPRPQLIEFLDDLIVMATRAREVLAVLEATESKVKP